MALAQVQLPNFIDLAQHLNALIILLIVFYCLLTERLVVGSTHKEIKESRDRWRQMYLDLRAQTDVARLTAMGQPPPPKEPPKGESP
jgi:hypothetical protein